MDKTIEFLMEYAQAFDEGEECLKIKRNYPNSSLNRYPLLTSQDSREEKNKGGTKQPTQGDTADAIQKLGDKLEQKCRDGTHKYLNIDSSNLFSPEYLQNPRIKGRNIVWIQDIFKKFQEIKAGTLIHPETGKTVEDMLLAFGASRLYGPDGILELLYKEGFDIWRALPDGTFIDYLIHKSIKIETNKEGLFEETKG